jgi:hypothetical protein
MLLCGACEAKYNSRLIDADVIGYITNGASSADHKLNEAMER